MSIQVYLYCLLVSTVSLSEADYSFTIRFFEFRNPLGLQCGECGNGGPPACCDDVQRLENCNTTRPFTCDTRFRFLLRSFGASVETAPNTGFPFFTPSNSLFNSVTFNEGPGGLLALPNPFTITRTEAWTGKIQFFIDAIDRAVPISITGISETLAIINRFPIDLEMNPGPDFTERTTYTGFYNISDVGFDMSFRVQCLENYFGPNCTTFCEPLEGVYTCDSEGRSACLQDNRDSTTNCMTCLPNYDPEQNCTQCMLGRTLSTNCTQCITGQDITTNCTTCLPGYDILTNCTTCLPNYDPEQNCTQCLLERTLSSNCTTCFPGFDPSTDCTQCVADRDITTNCTTCLPGYDILTNCTTCLFGCKPTSVDVQICPSQSSIETESAPSSASTPSVVVPAAVGGVLAVSVILNIILVIVVVVLLIILKGRGVNSSQSYEVKEQEAMDMEMKPNTVYGITSEGVTTETNDAYGVSQPHDPLAESQYEYVNP